MGKGRAGRQSPAAQASAQTPAGSGRPPRAPSESPSPPVRTLGSDDDRLGGRGGCGAAGRGWSVEGGGSRPSPPRAPPTAGGGERCRRLQGPFPRRQTDPLLEGRRRNSNPGPKPGLQLGRPRPCAKQRWGAGRGDAEGADEPSRRHVHLQTWRSRDAASNGGRGGGGGGRRASAPPTAPPSSPRASGVGAGCEGLGEGPAMPGVPASVGLPPPRPPPGPPPACSHAASRCRSPAELITTSACRSLGRCQAARLAASGGCGAPGRAEPSCGGRGAPRPGSTQDSVRKEGSGWAWGGGIGGSPARGGRACGAASKGGLPSRPHPSSL